MGPYHLDRLYPDSDPTVGHIYEAHHVTTGALALVLVPDASVAWAPRASWTVRSSSHVSPPFVALELERSPGHSTQAVHELTLMYIRLSAAASSVEDREDTARFLSQAPRPVPSPSRRRRALTVGIAALAGVALGAGALLLWPRVRPDAGETKTVAGEPTIWSDGNDDPSTIGYPMPSAPFEGQKKPPCKGTEEINGGCWDQLKQGAPCRKGYAEHEGKCYLPIREKPSLPRSVKP